MALSKTEQEILDGFQIERQRVPERIPGRVVRKIVGSYSTQGRREYDAAEKLVTRGLARIRNQETMLIAGRVHYYLTIEPVKPSEPEPEAKKKVRRTPKSTDGTKIETAGKAKRTASPPTKKAAKSWDARLRDRLAVCGESDNAIGQNCGIAQPIITRFRNGQRGLSFENGAKLAEYLGFCLVSPAR
jgi:hypothetical protein